MSTSGWFGISATVEPESHVLRQRPQPEHRRENHGVFLREAPRWGGVRLMEVVYVAPGKTLRLSGALGPLQAIAASGSMMIELSAAEGGTKLEVTYAVAGYLPAGMIPGLRRLMGWWKSSSRG